MCYTFPEPVYEEPEPSCDPSYPDFCIPPPPPDLDCGDIAQKDFTVIGDDPHRFDGDGDGIGCEGLMSAGKKKVNVCFACGIVAFTSEHHVKEMHFSQLNYCGVM